MSGRAAALHAEARATDLDLAQARLREAKARLRRLETAAARDADLWELRRRWGLAADAPLVLPEDPLQGTPEPAREIDLRPGDRGDGGDLADLRSGNPGDVADLADLRAGALAAARAADPDLVAAARSIELLERAIRLRHGFLAQVTLDADAQYSRLSRANGIDQFYVKFREDDIKATASLLNARAQLLAVRGELLRRLGLGESGTPVTPAPVQPAPGISAMLP